MVVLAVAGTFALRGSWPWHRLQEATPIVVTHAFTESQDTLREGETLSDLFARNGLDDSAINALTENGDFDPRRLRSGVVFSFRQDVADSTPSQVEFRSSADSRISFGRTGQAWSAEIHPISWRSEAMRLEGGIEASLYVALDEQVPDQMLDRGERVKLAWDLADTYMWEVDFTRDIRSGDHFQILMEREVSDEGEVRFGRILAAELNIGGKDLPAFRFKDALGRESFFDAKGNSLKRAFLRAPVQFRRISSGFSNGRMHPILNRIRAHQGTDYAADPGTPVMAAGNGTVVQAGHSGGYGNLIELRHTNGITTRYGHLRGFASGIRAGARVSQGQVIGYVGSTGLATGPHLHYEFRVNGVAKDARRIDLGNGEPVPTAERPGFEQARAALAAALYRSAPDPVATSDRIVSAIVP